MELVSFKNSRNKTVRGHLWSADSKSVIIMAHGFLSDRFSRGRFDVLGNTLNGSGFNVLAFDFCGCGESDDESLTAEKEVEDLHAAIDFVKQKGLQTIGLYGHSLGTLICLRSYSTDIKTMVLSGALTGPMHYNWNEFFTAEQLNELNQTGYITEPVNSKYRKNITIDAQMLKDFEEINQAELLQAVKCPVLIIHGNNPEDEEETELLQNSRKGMEFLSKESALEVIDGATHSFSGYIDILKDLANDWFIKKLK